MHRNNQVFVIGMDGATFDVITPLMEEGLLPNLARLMERGASGTLTSCLPELSPPAWTSFMTGVTPGSHGVMDFFGQTSADSYEVSFLNASYRKTKAMWTLLSDQGKRVCVVNVPFTFPPDQVNGTMISGMDTPSLSSEFVHPPAFRAELDQVTGGYQLERAERNLKRHRIDGYIRTIGEITENRFRATEHLLTKEAWDLFVVVFESTDRAQHTFWKFMDPKHPEFNQRDFKKYGNVIKDTYQDLDERLGRLMKQLPEDATVLVMSDHGFGPLYKGVRLNKWLQQEGYLKVSSDYTTGRNVISRERITALLPDSVRKVLRAIKGRRGGGAKPPGLAGFDMPNTDVYTVGGYGNLVINLQGRQAMGAVSPDRYEALRDELIKKLKQLKDPETGGLVIQDAWRREDVYPVFQDFIPDIIFRWSPGYYCVSEQELGFLGIKPDGDSLITIHRWSGNHLPNGVVFMAGPDVRVGSRIEDAEIIDIAPTIMALLGVAVPKYMDGKVLEGALTETFLQDHPLRYADYEGATGGDDKPFTDEESAKINERLKDLGYL